MRPKARTVRTRSEATSPDRIRVIAASEERESAVTLMEGATSYIID